MLNNIGLLYQFQRNHSQAIAYLSRALELNRKLRYRPRRPRFELLICLHGAGLLNGESLAPGHVWLLPAGSAVELAPRATLRLLRTYVPPSSDA